MAQFQVNRPIRGVDPTIVVDAGLPLGLHRFRLEVIDSAGLWSAPSEVVVAVSETRIVPPITRPGGTPIPGRPVPPPVGPGPIDPGITPPFRPR
jgi:hypothetical protein